MLDANLLASMFLFPNGFMSRLKEALCSENQILLCAYVVDELKDVVASKFPARPADIDWFLKSFTYTPVYAPERFNSDDYPEIRDIADLPVLVSAILEDADVLITGDKGFNDVKSKSRKSSSLMILWQYTAD
jgi:predicted nucleic acid-binding protein